MSLSLYSGHRKASVSLDVGSESHDIVGLHHSDCAFPRVSLFEEPPVLNSVLSESAQLKLSVVGCCAVG